MRGVRSTHERRRRGLTVAVLALTASILVPAAIALACNPQAYLTIDRSSYAPGESVRVAGSFFRGDADITVSVDRTGQSQTVRTTANGAFSTTFAMPQNAPTGGYSVQAIGFEANGDVIPGLPARGSFSVAAGAPASTQTSDEQQAQPAGQPAAQTSAPAPAAQPSQSAAQPAAAPQRSRPAQRQTFREPPVFSEPDVQQSRAERGSTGSTATESRSPAQSDTATSNGRQVFAGSVAPAPSFTTVLPAPRVVVAGPGASAQAARPRGASESRSAAGRSQQQPSPAVSRQTSEQTASDDLWSALSPGQSPSVLPVTGDGMAVESTSTGSGLALGLLLASGAVLALLGGLAVADARRRRVRVR
ncbi:MAG: hypothetical protein AVDCRST_MAG53-670 [uncultured Solirubrobacteraceae bacterium]|uniref:Macroglobulin domain-containing protein n=1 Tax=uncultured Solirubrobacteraceae bacterium TaxID=1162706 RepID=A0A6J4S167_9ACTN|nr:MAG: hypothetical protein AVDCRST_MAG53-670 [uncultured Solirubrobacteraceae bacterium]